MHIAAYSGDASPSPRLFVGAVYFSHHRTTRRNPRKLLHLAWALGSKQRRFDPGFKQ